MCAQGNDLRTKKNHSLAIATITNKAQLYIAIPFHRHIYIW